MIQQGGEALHNSGAPLRNLAKDIAISKNLATELGLELPILNETSKVCQTAMTLNKGGADMVKHTFCCLKSELQKETSSFYHECHRSHRPAGIHLKDSPL